MKTTTNAFLIPALLLAAALGTADCARAADLSATAAGTNPFMPARSDWLGPYAGLTLGYLGAGMDIGRGAGQSDLELREEALSLGAVAGYNIATFGETGTSRWLIGVEADLSRVPSGKKKADPILGTVNTEVAWIGSLRLRGGYATERLFLYGTAGMGLSDLDPHVAGQADRDSLRAGLTLGLGAEMAFGGNWAARAEGIVYGFGEDEMTIAGAKRDIGTGFVTARFGLIRRF